MTILERPTIAAKSHVQAVTTNAFTNLAMT